MSTSGKERAAQIAAERVETNSVIGLGTGSTAELFVKALGKRVQQGLRVKGVPTSERTATLAQQEGITLTTLEEYPSLALAVDGADAVDPRLNLLKGLGGALLREKIVAAATQNFIVIVDDSKIVQSLTQAPIVPVEVVPFGWSRTQAALTALGAACVLRKKKADPNAVFLTDGGNYIIDATFGKQLDQCEQLAKEIKSIVGVVEHGIFAGMTTEVIVGNKDGSSTVLKAGKN